MKSLLSKFSFLLCSLSLLGCQADKSEVVQLDLNANPKLCFFGDAGTGTKNQLEVSELLVNEDCQAYFYLGDIIYPKGISSANDPQLKRLFLDVYSPIFEKKDLFLTMGNHDYPGNVDAWLEIADRYPKLHYPAHYYLARINDICLPVLNTTDYKLGQVFWLERLELEGCESVILVGHHPAKSSGKHKKPYFPLNAFLNYAISFADIFVSGHDHHLSYEGKVRGTHQFVSGAGGQLRPLDEDLAVWGKSQLGYLTMERGQGSYLFTFWGLAEDGSKEELFSKKIDLSTLAND